MNILQLNATRNTRFFLVCILILAGLWATSLYSDLLFHTLAELFNVVVAGTIFILAWNFRYFYRDRFLVFIGTAFLFIGLIDLLHILTFPGMVIFQGYDTNTSVQLWVAALLSSKSVAARRAVVSAPQGEYRLVDGDLWPADGPGPAVDLCLAKLPNRLYQWQRADAF